ncbi:acyltransferase family protein [Paracoccus sp. JM45]|uniref:acyltransferase family protein n=1 Tax=Paracoccus sp. JM45 TaxID=2283626 RepID=UPI0011C481D5|nr:acyltransferase family protein [Paracoccus sp. JM45]
MIIRKINIIYSIFITISFSILSLYVIENAKFPNGINLILQNLGERGFLYFTIGFLFSANLIKPIKTRLFFTLLSVVVWISCYFLIENINMRDNFLKSICWLLISFPATISAVYILQFSIDNFPIISKFFSYIGQRSLELFLIHQFFIAALFIIVRPFAETTLGIFPLTFIFIFTIIFSLLLAAILRKIPGNAFFAVPKVSWRKSFPKIKPLF